MLICANPCKDKRMPPWNAPILLLCALASGCAEHVCDLPGGACGGRELLSVPTVDADAASSTDAASPEPSQDGGQASVADAATLLDCQQADLELGRMRRAIDPVVQADLVRCTSALDCTTWMPLFACPELDVTIYPPATAVAVGKAEAAQSQVDALEPMLCPRIARGCRATGDLGAATLRCVANACQLSAPGDGG